MLFNVNCINNCVYIGWCYNVTIWRVVSFSVARFVLWSAGSRAVSIGSRCLKVIVAVVVLDTPPSVGMFVQSLAWWCYGSQNHHHRHSSVLCFCMGRARQQLTSQRALEHPGEGISSGERAVRSYGKLALDWTKAFIY